MKKLSCFAIVGVFLLACACNTPDTVAKFCSSAVVTLKSGDALFDDISASCVREAQTREPFATFEVTDTTPPACDEIGKQASGLKAAGQLLAEYFKALNDLASFGTTTAGSNASSLAKTAAAQAKLSSNAQTAIGSIAGLLTQIATGGYQQKALATNIVKHKADVDAVLGGLGEAVGVVYLQMLKEEENKTITRYREYLLQHPDATLALDSRWQNDRTSFASKIRAAQAYQDALNTLIKGNDDLAAHANNLSAKNLPGLLSPYVSQLESMVPAIQKAFF